MTGEPERRPRRRRALRIAGVVLLVLTMLVGITSIVPTDYYSIAPGSARAADKLVEASGVATYPNDQKLLYTTVSVGPDTLLEAFFDWIDPDVDLVDKDLYLPKGVSRAEERRQSIRVMGASKKTAIYVALTKLGYPVKVSGGGVIVTEVGAGLPAAKVLQTGDVITAIDGTPISLPDQIAPLLQGKKAGETVTLTVKRGDAAPAPMPVELSTTEDGRTIIGLTGPQADDAATFTYPFALDLDTGETGGPSAGLAFTLTLIDLLTPGSLTGGKKVAVTGTIDLDGQVGAIGGLRQKVVTVEQAGAEVFLVPASQLDVAQKEAGSHLKVIGVSNLDDALAALASVGGNADELGTPGAALGG